MKKDKGIQVKDVIHLYLGCDVEIDETILQLKAVGLGGWTASNDKESNTIHGKWGYKDIKPILRPLSGMTEEEWKKCFELSRGLFEQSISDKIARMSTNEVLITLGKGQYTFGYHYCCDNDVRIGDGLCFYLKSYLIKDELFVGSNGIESNESWFNNMQLEQVLNISHIFTYLLSKGFDLFCLIESNQAINKTSIK